MTTLGFSGRVRRTRYQISAGAYAPVAPALTAALHILTNHPSVNKAFFPYSLKASMLTGALDEESLLGQGQLPAER